MAQDGAVPIMVCLDLRDGLEGIRILVVERTAGDRLTLRTADEEAVTLLWTHCRGVDLDAAIASLFLRFVA